MRAGRELIGAMPAVSAVLARLGFDAIVAAGLGEPGTRRGIAPATVTGVLVRNLAVGREPLYALAEWAAGYEPALLGLRAGQAALLNDDRAGRALDDLYAADRATMRACQIFCVSWGSRCPFVTLLRVVSGVRVRRGHGRGT